MILGIVLATRKGFYLIKLINVMILFIPIAFCSFIIYYCFVVKTDFTHIASKIEKLTHEKFPRWIFVC